MSTLSYIGLFGGILSLCGYIPYMKRIIEGKEQPERATWLIWTLSNALLFLSYFVLGARTTIWVPLAYLVGSALITVLAFIYGKPGWGLLEKVALVVSILTSIRWVYFDKPVMTMLFNLAIGLVSWIRRIRHLATDKTAQEDLSGWGFYFVGAALNLAAVTPWTPLISVLPITMFIMNGLILILALRNRKYAPKLETTE
jgi:hypothetical protein